MDFKDILKNKKVIIAASIFTVLIVGVLIRWFWERSVAAEVNILIAPRSSLITLNGKKISNGKHYISPGKYTIKAEKEGFFENSIDFEVKSKEVKEITFALATEDGSDDWYIKNRQDDLIRSGAGYKIISENMELIKKNSPIAKKLPYRDTLKSRFNINYKANASGQKIDTIFINIDTCYNPNSKIDSEEYRKSRALKWLEENFEKSEKEKYKIEYKLLPCIRH